MTWKKRAGSWAAPMFEVGDVVVWESQSSGHVKRKSGSVIAVLIPREICDRGRFTNPQFSGGIRNHTSYVVMCDGKTYWPMVRYLQRA
jgi:hypothetical protein